MLVSVDDRNALSLSLHVLDFADTDVQHSVENVVRDTRFLRASFSSFFFLHFQVFCLSLHPGHLSCKRFFSQKEYGGGVSLTICAVDQASLLHATCQGRHRQ